MGKKAKRFDCVEMKRQAQEKLRAEYEQRRSEFGSYVEFLNAKAEESELWQRMRRKTDADSGR
jgi:hypothetical protein